MRHSGVVPPNPPGARGPQLVPQVFPYSGWEPGGGLQRASLFFGFFSYILTHFFIFTYKNKKKYYKYNPTPPKPPTPWLQIFDSLQPVTTSVSDPAQEKPPWAGRYRLNACFLPGRNRWSVGASQEKDFPPAGLAQS